MITSSGYPDLGVLGASVGGALLDHRVLQFGDEVYPRDYTPEDLAGARLFILHPVCGVLWNSASEPRRPL